ncbi:MAG: peptidoglycan DD-metalloendopeptidase family protein [Desulfonatronovibrionaceae bacterium]
MSDILSGQAGAQLEQGRAAGKALEMEQLRKRLGAGQNQEKELRKACEQFESVFLQKIWEQMRSTVPKEGYLHSKEQDMYQSMFDEELSKDMARSGGIGLAEMMYGQLSKRFENSADEASSVAPAELNPLPDRKKLPGQAEQTRESAKSLDSSQINKILNMDASPEKKADMLAAQIEYHLGEGSAQDPPELDGTAGQKQTPKVDSGDDLPPLHTPVSGRISSDFGWRQDPFTGEKAWHAGVDYAVAENSPVEACWPGRVIFSGEHGGYGNKVVIEHAGGWQSVYAHNKENLVREGDQVDAGQQIALSGNTGRSTGPHLHFELRQNDLAWNPVMIKERLLAGLDIGSRENQVG